MGDDGAYFNPDLNTPLRYEAIVCRVGERFAEFGVLVTQGAADYVIDKWELRIRSLTDMGAVEESDDDWEVPAAQSGDPRESPHGMPAPAKMFEQHNTSAQSRPRHVMFDAQMSFAERTVKMVKLRPGNVYFAQVRCLVKDMVEWGPWSAEVRTMTYLPVNTTVSAVGESYVRISWDRPPRDTAVNIAPERYPEDTLKVANIHLFELRIVREVDMFEEYYGTFNAGVRSFIHHGLCPGTPYIVFVRYATLIGTMKAWTEAGRFYTQVAEELNVASCTENAFSVSWARGHLPENLIGYTLPDLSLQMFEISVEGVGVTERCVQLPASQRMYRVSDACPGSNYVITLRSMSKDGCWGVCAEPIVVRTADNPVITTEAVGETFLSFSWTRPAAFTSAHSSVDGDSAPSDSDDLDGAAHVSANKEWETPEAPAVTKVTDSKVEYEIRSLNSDYTRTDSVDVDEGAEPKLLHVTGLCANTQYTISMRMWLLNEWGVWSDAVMCKTAPKPLLVFVERGEGTLTVEWSSPIWQPTQNASTPDADSGSPRMFRYNVVVYCLPNGEGVGNAEPTRTLMLDTEVVRSATSRGYTVGNLKAETMYEVQCRLWQRNPLSGYEDWGEFSEPIRSQTLESVVVNVWDLGEDFVQLVWRRGLADRGRTDTMQSAAATNSSWEDLKYEVVVGCIDTGEDRVVHRHVLDTTCVISNLRPATRYVVSVRACNDQEQWGVWVTRRIRTLASVKTSLHEIGENFVRLVWQRDQTNLVHDVDDGDPTGNGCDGATLSNDACVSQYGVFVYSNEHGMDSGEAPSAVADYPYGGNSEVALFNTVQSQHTSCRVGGLLPDREYVAVVRGATTTGKWGLWSPPIRFRTNSQFYVPAHDLTIGENYVNLTWCRDESPVVPPEVHLGDMTVRAQQVRVRGVDSTFAKDYDLAAELRDLKVYGLAPMTAYSIQIRICGKSGDWGSWSAPVHILTRGTILTKAVEIAEDYAIVTWERRKLGNPKNYPTGMGIVTAYHLRVFNLSGIHLDTFLGDGDCPYRVSGLTPDTYYCVELKANYNSEEWGLWSTPLWCLTMKPMEVQTQLISEEFCRVSIIRPPQQKRLPEDDGNRGSNERVLAFGELRPDVMLCVTTPQTMPSPFTTTGNPSTSTSKTTSRMLPAQSTRRGEAVEDSNQRAGDSSLPPDCTNHRLVYQTELNFYATEMEHTVPNLKSNNVYSVSVRSKLASGEWGMWSSPSQRFATVPATQVTFTDIGEDFVAVEWSRGPQTLLSDAAPSSGGGAVRVGAGVVTKSRVKLRELTGAFQQTFEVGDGQSTYFIERLNPAVSYGVSVQTFNDSFDWGVWSEEARVRTVPAMVVAIQHISEDAVWATWWRRSNVDQKVTLDTSMNVDAVVDAYELCVTGDGGFSVSKELDTDAIFFRGLQPDTVYECQVRARLKHIGRWGLWSARAFRTQPTMRVTFGNVGEHFAVVEWRRHLPSTAAPRKAKEVVEATDVVQQYRLKLEQVRGGTPMVFELSPTASAFRLTQLQPSSEYRVWMCAKGHEGVWGLWNEESRVRTLPKLEIGLVSVGEDYVVVSWKRMSWQGDTITGDDIKATTTTGAVSAYQIRVLDPDGEEVSTLTVGHNSASCTIPHLGLDTMYSVQVRGKDTYGEWGLWSDPQFFSTLTAVRMEINRIGEDFVEVEWCRESEQVRRMRELRAEKRAQRDAERKKYNANSLKSQRRVEQKKHAPKPERPFRAAISSSAKGREGGGPGSRPASPSSSSPAANGEAEKLGGPNGDGSASATRESDEEEEEEKSEANVDGDESDIAEEEYGYDNSSDEDRSSSMYDDSSLDSISDNDSFDDDLMMDNDVYRGDEHVTQWQVRVYGHRVFAGQPGAEDFMEFMLEENTERMVICPLQPFATYSVTVRAKNTSGEWGQWHKQREFRTLPLLETSVEYVGETFINVGWHRPLYDESACIGEQIVFQPLTGIHNYQVLVRPLSGEPEFDRSDELLIEGARVYETTQRALRVGNLVPGCRYRVTVREQRVLNENDNSNGERERTAISSSSSSASPGSKPTVKAASGGSEAGALSLSPSASGAAYPETAAEKPTAAFGAWSEMRLVETLGMITAEPREIGENYCFVGWRRLAREDDHVELSVAGTVARPTAYELHIVRMNDTAEEEYTGLRALNTTFNFSAEVTSYSLGNLIPNTIYAVSCRAQTEGGHWGMWSTSTMFITQGRLELNVKVINEDSVVVEWLRGMPAWAAARRKELVEGGDVRGTKATSPSSRRKQANGQTQPSSGRPKRGNKQDGASEDARVTAALASVVVGEYSVDNFELIVEGVSMIYHRVLQLDKSQTNAVVRHLAANSIYSFRVWSRSATKRQWSLPSLRVCVLTLPHVRLHVKNHTEHGAIIEWKRDTQEIDTFAALLEVRRAERLRACEQRERKELYELQQRMQGQPEESRDANDFLLNHEARKEHYAALREESVLPFELQNVQVGVPESMAHELLVYSDVDCPPHIESAETLLRAVKPPRTGGGFKGLESSDGVHLVSVKPPTFSGILHVRREHAMGIARWSEYPSKKMSVSSASRMSSRAQSTIVDYAQAQQLANAARTGDVEQDGNPLERNRSSVDTAASDAAAAFMARSSAAVADGRRSSEWKRSATLVMNSLFRGSAGEARISNLVENSCYLLVLRSRNSSLAWGPWCEPQAVTTLSALTLEQSRFGEHYINLFWHRMNTQAEASFQKDVALAESMDAEFHHLSGRDVETLRRSMGSAEYQTLLSKLMHWQQLRRTIAQRRKQMADGLGDVVAAENTPVQGYKLRLVHENGSTTESYITDTGSGSHAFTATGLVPNSPYVALLCPDYGMGMWGLWTKPLRFVTQNLILMQVTYIGESFVHIEWKRAPNKKLLNAEDERLTLTNPTVSGKGHVYQLRMSHVDPVSGEEVEEYRSMKDRNVFRVDALRPDTKYTFAVREWDNKGDWGLWCEPKMCVTLPEMVTHIDHLTEGEVSVSWSRVPRKTNYDDDLRVMQYGVEPVAYYLLVEEMEEEREDNNANNSGNNNNNNNSNKNSSNSDGSGLSQARMSIASGINSNNEVRKTSAIPRRSTSATAPSTEIPTGTDGKHPAPSQRISVSASSRNAADDAESREHEISWSASNVHGGLASAVEERKEEMDDEAAEEVREARTSSAFAGDEDSIGTSTQLAKDGESSGSVVREESGSPFTPLPDGFVSHSILSSHHGIDGNASDPIPNATSSSSADKLFEGSFSGYSLHLAQDDFTALPLTQRPVERDPLPGERFVLVKRFDASVTSFTVPGLRADRFYNVRVVCETSLNQLGAWSVNNYFATMRRLTLTATSIDETFMDVSWARLSTRLHPDLADENVFTLAYTATSYQIEAYSFPTDAGRSEVEKSTARAPASNDESGVTVDGTKSVSEEQSLSFGAPFAATPVSILKQRLGAKTTTFSLKGLQLDRLYSIRVRSFDELGKASQWSDALHVATLSPLQVQPLRITEQSMSLTWSRLAQDIDAFTSAANAFNVWEELQSAKDTSRPTSAASHRTESKKPESVQPAAVETPFEDYSSDRTLSMQSAPRNSALNRPSAFVHLGDPTVTVQEVCVFGPENSTTPVYERVFSSAVESVHVTALKPNQMHMVQVRAQNKRKEWGAWSEKRCVYTMKLLRVDVAAAGEDYIRVRWSRSAPSGGTAEMKDSLSLMDSRQDFSQVQPSSANSRAAPVYVSAHTMISHFVVRIVRHGETDGQEFEVHNASAASCFTIAQLTPDTRYTVSIRTCYHADEGETEWGPWSPLTQSSTRPLMAIDSRSAGEDYVSFAWHWPATTQPTAVKMGKIEETLCYEVELHNVTDGTTHPKVILLGSKVKSLVEKHLIPRNRYFARLRRWYQPLSDQVHDTTCCVAMATPEGRQEDGEHGIEGKKAEVGRKSMASTTEKDESAADHHPLLRIPSSSGLDEELRQHVVEAQGLAGPWSGGITVNTLCNMTCSVCDITEDSFLVRWERNSALPPLPAADRPARPSQQHELSVEQLTPDGLAEDKSTEAVHFTRSFTADESTYRVNHLQPDVVFRVRIRACVDRVWGEWSENVCILTLPRLRITAKSIGEDYTTLSWERPMRQLQLPGGGGNAVVGEDKGVEKYHLDVVGLDSNFHLEKKVKANKCTYRVKLLLPNAIYSACVRSLDSTTNAWSMWSDRIAFVTMKPLRVTVGIVGENFAHVSWYREAQSVEEYETRGIKSVPKRIATLHGSQHNLSQPSSSDAPELAETRSGTSVVQEEHDPRPQTAQPSEHEGATQPSSVWAEKRASSMASGPLVPIQDVGSDAEEAGGGSPCAATERPMNESGTSRPQEAMQAVWVGVANGDSREAEDPLPVQFGEGGSSAYHLCVFPSENGPATAVVDKQFADDVTHCRVSQLAPNASYVVVVRACDLESQWGLWSEEVPLHTQAQLQLHMQVMGECYATVTWDRVDGSRAKDTQRDREHFKEPESYRVVLRDEDGVVAHHKVSSDEFEAFGEQPAYTIRGLRGNTTYMIAVQPFYEEEDWGMWSRAVNMRTLGPLNVHVSRVTEERVDIAWFRRGSLQPPAQLVPGEDAEVPAGVAGTMGGAGVAGAAAQGVSAAFGGTPPYGIGLGVGPENAKTVQFQLILEKYDEVLQRRAAQQAEDAEKENPATSAFEEEEDQDHDLNNEHSFRNGTSNRRDTDELTNIATNDDGNQSVREDGGDNGDADADDSNQADEASANPPQHVPDGDDTNATVAGEDDGTKEIGDVAGLEKEQDMSNNGTRKKDSKSVSSENERLRVEHIFDARQTRCTISQLERNTTYCVHVRSLDDYGEWGSWAELIFDTVPPPPSNLTISKVNAQFAMLQWEPPSTTCPYQYVVEQAIVREVRDDSASGGARNAAAALRSSAPDNSFGGAGGGEREHLDWKVATTCSSSSCQVRIHVHINRVRFRVKCARLDRSMHVYSDYTPPASITSGHPPNAVTELILSVLSRSSATIDWTPPSESLGATMKHIAANYAIAYKVLFAKEKQPASTIVSTRSTSYTIKELEPSTEYRIHIVAENSFGSAEPSPILRFTTKAERDRSVSRNEGSQPPLGVLEGLKSNNTDQGKRHLPEITAGPASSEPIVPTGNVVESSPQWADDVAFMQASVTTTTRRPSMATARSTTAESARRGPGAASNVRLVSTVPRRSTVQPIPPPQQLAQTNPLQQRRGKLRGRSQDNNNNTRARRSKQDSIAVAAAATAPAALEPQAARSTSRGKGRSTPGRQTRQREQGTPPAAQPLAGRGTITSTPGRLPPMM